MRATPLPALLLAAVLLAAGPAFGQSPHDGAVEAHPAASLQVLPGFVIVPAGESGRVLAILDGAPYAAYTFSLRGVEPAAVDLWEARAWTDGRGHAEATLVVSTRSAPAHPVQRATLVATDDSGIVVEASLDVIVLPPPTPSARPSVPPILRAPPTILVEQPARAMPLPTEVAPLELRPAPPPFARLFSLFRGLQARPIPVEPMLPPPMVAPPMLAPPMPFPLDAPSTIPLPAREFRTIDLRPLVLEVGPGVGPGFDGCGVRFEPVDPASG